MKEVLGFLVVVVGIGINLKVAFSQFTEAAAKNAGLLRATMDPQINSLSVPCLTSPTSSQTWGS